MGGQASKDNKRQQRNEVKEQKPKRQISYAETESGKGSGIREIFRKLARRITPWFVIEEE